MRSVFADNATTASGRKRRPGFQAMLAYLAYLAYLAGQPGTTVVVWHTDRLHWQLAELESYIQLAEDHGIVTRAVGPGTLTSRRRAAGWWPGCSASPRGNELEHMSERRRGGKARAGARFLALGVLATTPRRSFP